MKVNQVIYDCKTKQTRIEEIEVEDIVEEIPITPQEPTLEERVAELEKINEEQSKLIKRLLLSANLMELE